ncbi:neurofilament medium polypeptide isoform X1 [Cyclopterus lumpus]|uniref:neurofilament medium polypeptide isoform X1 n=1 Tax=Cyclopterus lumpus TaxID=8103 RepID=UPI001486947A|nr:neurofilament medium polypeptide isoform X1 [Cyclopterus lumpus]
MKVQCVLLMPLVVSVAMVAIVHIRKTEFNYEEKKSKFMEIKLRITNDVLQDRRTEELETKALLEKSQLEQIALQKEVNTLELKADETVAKSDACLGGKKSATDELASAETELQNLKAEYDKETTDLKNQLETLKRQQTERSAVCGFLKPGSHLASCGSEVIAEAPKPEGPKAEAPKPEEPKAEAPKAEAPKPEEPKAEAPKAEAPKPEEPKAEAPKAEEPKAAAPKPEEPKAEAPKPEEPKALKKR